MKRTIRDFWAIKIIDQPEKSTSNRYTPQQNIGGETFFSAKVLESTQN